MNSPLLELENCVTSPHLGASTEEAQVNVAIEIAQQVVDALSGKTVRNAINVPAIEPEVLALVKPYLTLGEKLGSLQAQLAEGRIQEVNGLFFDNELVKNNSEIVKTYRLHDNYPNPFNPVTTIKFEIPVSCRVSLKIYDILGREAATLIDTRLDAGMHIISWDASRFSSGIYFYRLAAGDFTQSKRMILVK